MIKLFINNLFNSYFLGITDYNNPKTIQQYHKDIQIPLCYKTVSTNRVLSPFTPPHQLTPPLIQRTPPHFQIKFILNWEHPTCTELFLILLSKSLGDMTCYLATESGSNPRVSIVPKAGSIKSSMGKLDKQRLFAVRRLFHN